MGKAINFIEGRINTHGCNGMERNHYDSMWEVDLIQWLSAFGIWPANLIDLLQNPGGVSYVLDAKLEDGNPVKLDIKLNHDPNAPFDYFTMERCNCDGTLSFFNDLTYRVFHKVCFANTVNKTVLPDDFYENLSQYKVSYVVGNFVYAIEHGKEFATESKPWMLDRFTVMLPIQMSVTKRQ